ncbi:hypothetical protein HELRODRAFT_192106 [Helobdella robusta]|uniref:Uncharacterized protein n=1 Tax=Helobdella robusta TaxID=6412 RepID=T1FTK6_HELRO|nr:hypothetical protein HELRODRAFT_192106 [Helobdella robusta]ESO03078.1 hypothetical protein HELRODRAFT_192106 [Helobdella robusta]
MKQSTPLSELKTLCYEQLDVMSCKRILSILRGMDPTEISSTEDEDESVGNADDNNQSSTKPAADMRTSQELSQLHQHQKRMSPCSLQNLQQQMKGSSSDGGKQPVQSQQQNQHALEKVGDTINDKEQLIKSTSTAMAFNASSTPSTSVPNSSKMNNANGNNTIIDTSDTTTNNSSSSRKSITLKTSHDLNVMDEDELDYDEEVVQEDAKTDARSNALKPQNFEYNSTVAELFVDNINDDFNDDVDDKVSDDSHQNKEKNFSDKNDNQDAKLSTVEQKVDDRQIIQTNSSNIKTSNGLCNDKSSDAKTGTWTSDTVATKQVVTKSSSSSSSLCKTSSTPVNSKQSSSNTTTTKEHDTTSPPPISTSSSATTNANNTNKIEIDKTQLEILELEMRARAIKAMLKAQEELEQMQHKQKQSADKKQSHSKSRDVELRESSHRKKDNDVKKRKSSSRHDHGDRDAKYTRKVSRLPSPANTTDEAPVQRIMMRKISPPAPSSSSSSHRRFDSMRTSSYDVLERDCRRSDYVDYHRDDFMDDDGYRFSHYRNHPRVYEQHQHHHPEHFSRSRIVYMPLHDDRDDDDRRMRSRYDDYDDVGGDYDYCDDYRDYERPRGYRGRPACVGGRRSRDDFADDRYDDDRRFIRR